MIPGLSECRELGSWQEGKDRAASGEKGKEAERETGRVAETPRRGLLAMGQCRRSGEGSDFSEKLSDH